MSYVVGSWQTPAEVTVDLRTRPSLRAAVHFLEAVKLLLIDSGDLLIGLTDVGRLEHFPKITCLLVYRYRRGVDRTRVQIFSSFASDVLSCFQYFDISVQQDPPARATVPTMCVVVDCVADVQIAIRTETIRLLLECDF